MIRAIVQSLAVAFALSVLAGCAEWSPQPPRADVEGCYNIVLPGADQDRAPAPPLALDLTGLPFVTGPSPRPSIDFHRFDALAAKEAYFVYADTVNRVAWWWASEQDNRLGVGNYNQAAAYYIEGVVRGDRFQGELRRWRFDDDGEPVRSADSYALPVSGRRTSCRPR